MVISWYSPSGVQRRTHISCGCSPPARWGLLDFIRAVLLLRLLTRRLLPAVQIPGGRSRTSTASSRSQWALPDLHREHDFQIAVGTAGPQPRLPDRSGHCRTPTATSRSQWALPDLNRDFQIAVSRMKCSFWCPHVSRLESLVSCGLAVSMGEAAKAFLFEGFQLWILAEVSHECSFFCPHVSRLESLVFLWLRRVYEGSCKTSPFRRFPSRFAWQAWHFVTFQLVW